MLVSTKDIGWGAYGGYEGPFFRGRHRYVVPDEPSLSDKILAVITATEGGAYDAINMYDGQILSTTLIQVTEKRYFTASKALGFAVEKDESLAGMLSPALELCDASFVKGPRGWRIHYRSKEPPSPVATEEQQSMMMLGCSGKQGSWGSESEERAKTWAAVVASFWGKESAQRAQVEFIAPRLYDYAFYHSREAVEAATELGTDMSMAFVAAYLSFAVNSPVRAAKHLTVAAQKTKYRTFSEGWLIELLNELTFGPRIAIYPHRYKAIRPVLERLFSIDIPDLPEDLKDWKGPSGELYDAKGIQEMLIDLGYDLGPCKADGRIGKMTSAAIRAFEEKEGLPPDGSLDIDVVNRLREVWETSQKG